MPSTTLATPGILLVDNSPSFARMVAARMGERLGLPVTVVATLAEARRELSEPGRYFLAFTGLVLADADSETILDAFAASNVPTVVVSGVYDDEVRQRVLGRNIVDCAAARASCIDSTWPGPATSRTRSTSSTA